MALLVLEVVSASLWQHFFVDVHGASGEERARPLEEGLGFRAEAGAEPPAPLRLSLPTPHSVCWPLPTAASIAGFQVPQWEHTAQDCNTYPHPLVKQVVPGNRKIHFFLQHLGFPSAVSQDVLDNSLQERSDYLRP